MSIIHFTKNKKATDLPFNRCDYYCEKCNEKSSCRLYKMEQKRNKQLIAQGKDLNDPKIAFEEIGNNLRKASRMITEEAKRRGIDLAKELQDDLSEFDPKDLPICKKSREFTIDVHKLVKFLEEIINQEQIHDLLWHASISSSKIYRAYSWTQKAIDEFGDEDKVNSINVAYKSAALCKEILKNISSGLTAETQEECNRLIAEISEVMKNILNS
jgi:hypothetical protein